MISSILVLCAVNLCVIGYAVSKLLYYSVLGGAAAAPWQQQKAGSSSAVKGRAPPAPAANGAPSTPRQQASASEDEWGKVCTLMIMVYILVIVTLPSCTECLLNLPTLLLSIRSSAWCNKVE